MIATSEININSVTLPDNSPDSHATTNSNQDAIENVTKMSTAAIISVSECGGGLWYSVASLDVTDPQQQCPTGWREYNKSSVRAHG